MAVYKMTATKANLQRAKSTLAFLRTGYDLLDKKRIVLVREQNVLKEKVRDLEVTLNRLISRALPMFNYLFVTVGAQLTDRMSKAIPIDNSIDIVYRSLMGVSVPDLESEDVDVTIPEMQADPAFDRAMELVKEFKARLLEYTGTKVSVNKLQREIDKTQKRANALDKVQIPRYEQMVYNMEQILEEKEREEFFRLKRVKSSHKKNIHKKVSGGMANETERVGQA